jgi:hypothetical protein
MRKGVSRGKEVQMVKPSPVPAGQAVGRQRTIGPRHPCPNCQEGDGFVASTRRCYPQFIANVQRIRYFKCGRCGHTWKG